MHETIFIYINIGIAVGIIQAVQGQQAHILGMLIHHRQLRRAAVGQRIRIGKLRLHREQAGLGIHHMADLRHRTLVAAAVLLHRHRLAELQILHDILGHIEMKGLRPAAGQDAELGLLGNHGIDRDVLIFNGTVRRRRHGGIFHLGVIIQLRAGCLSLCGVCLGLGGLIILGRDVAGLVEGSHTTERVPGCGGADIGLLQRILRRIDLLLVVQLHDGISLMHKLAVLHIALQHLACRLGHHRIGIGGLDGAHQGNAVGDTSLAHARQCHRRQGLGLYGLRRLQHSLQHQGQHTDGNNRSGGNLDSFFHSALLSLGQAP